jgi:hypothetical protein
MKSEQLVGAVALLGVTAAINVGCVAHAQASGYAEADAPVVFVEPPTLVSVDADVWVVRDYDYSVYYVGDYYWVYRNNAWYRARSYDSGWVVVDAAVVPAVIVHRDHHAYVHYRGEATARTRPAPREHGSSEEAERHHGPPDHAAEQHGGPPGHDETPGLGNQRRAEEGSANNGKKEEKAEKKEEKAEKKADKKDEKKDKPKKR